MNQEYSTGNDESAFKSLVSSHPSLDSKSSATISESRMSNSDSGEESFLESDDLKASNSKALKVQKSPTLVNLNAKNQSDIGNTWKEVDYQILVAN